MFGALYLAWLINNLNSEAYILSFPFFLSQLFIYLSFALSIRNHWNTNFRTERPTLTKYPPVAVIIPTYNEPVSILKKTIKSILRINYPGEVIILVSNDSKQELQREKIENILGELSDYWQNEGYTNARGYRRELHLMHTLAHDGAKAGNLNQGVAFFRKYYPYIDFLLTQDADEVVMPDILLATMGYFVQKPNVAYVQTIKQARGSPGDPFGNNDALWYARTAVARDFDNAMFACGSGVIWRISALESVHGFSTWNLVEDLTTSYNLLAQEWEGRYHFEALSRGLAPEDLPNYLKQRGTWALDTLRIFFWDNPLTKNNLTLKQRLQFLELPLFYLNGIFMLLMIAITLISLLTKVWPTTASAATHAMFLMPGFISMELYYFLLSGIIPVKHIRQLQVSMSPVFAQAAVKALLFGKSRKPDYKVTQKENTYGNYTLLVVPQIAIVVLLTLGIINSIVGTPLYSRFDWAIVFWGLYQTTFYIKIVRLSWWKWSPEISWGLPRFQLPLRPQTTVNVSYSPDTL